MAASRMRTLALAALITSATLAGGCYTPGGSMFSHPSGPYTYWSTEVEPKTFTLLDLRTGETIMTIDIPTGQQLVIDFSTGEGDDPAYSPDLMRYDIMDIGTGGGRLRNSITVPEAHARRIDLTIRSGVEAAQPKPGHELRVDELADRPQGWTPAGGPVPDDDAHDMYDG